jgi:hypothetical protein
MAALLLAASVGLGLTLMRRHRQLGADAARGAIPGQEPI